MTRIQRHNLCGEVLPPAIIPKAIDTIAPAIYIVFLAAFLLGWWEKGRLSVNSLVFLSSTTMFWQEFYADWGVYLHWNSDLRLLPSGKKLGTTANKPFYVIFTHGLFYLLLLSGNYNLFRWTQNKNQSGVTETPCSLTSWCLFFSITCSLPTFSDFGPTTSTIYM
jgi:hypothetical protein